MSGRNCAGGRGGGRGGAAAVPEAVPVAAGARREREPDDEGPPRRRQRRDSASSEEYEPQAARDGRGQATGRNPNPFRNAELPDDFVVEIADANVPLIPNDASVTIDHSWVPRRWIINFVIRCVRFGTSATDIVGWRNNRKNYQNQVIE